jgi:nucleoside-diphosphate-sugar epimerase
MSAAHDVVITGATGWLGQRLLGMLSGSLPIPDNVKNLDHPRSIKALVHESEEHQDSDALQTSIEFIRGDIRDINVANSLFADTESATVYHCAGMIHPKLFTSSITSVNVNGTANILNAAAAAGARRVVVVSSNSAFGFNPDPLSRFDEQSEFSPYMTYGKSKRETELLAQKFSNSTDLEIVVIRVPWFFGPGQPPRQSKFFSLIRQGRFPTLGNGLNKRSLAYTDDICQALLLAVTKAKASGETYWVADDDPYTMNEIISTVADVLKSDFGFQVSDRRPRVPATVSTAAMAIDWTLQKLGLYSTQAHVLSEMSRTIACSTDKARRELGYSPTVGLREGMRISIEWCINNGVTI